MIPQWDAVDLEIGAVLAHANCWRKFAISCNNGGVNCCGEEMSGYDPKRTFVSDISALYVTPFGRLNVLPEATRIHHAAEWCGCRRAGRGAGIAIPAPQAQQDRGAMR